MEIVGLKSGGEKALKRGRTLCQTFIGSDNVCRPFRSCESGKKRDREGSQREDIVCTNGREISQ